MNKFSMKKKSNLWYQLVTVTLAFSCITLIFICYILIYIKIRTTRQNLITYGSVISHRNEVRYFRMTLIVLSSIIISQLGISLFELMRSAQNAGENSLFKFQVLPEETMDDWLYVAVYINGLLPVWINPIIYVLSNKSYRNAYVQMLKFGNNRYRTRRETFYSQRFLTSI